MANPPAKCIFCGGYGLTREHVIPDWMREIIPHPPGSRHGFAPAYHQPVKVMHIRQGHPGTKKVRCVCRRCNNGWLSELEGELKPCITDLVLYRPTTLTPWSQRRLATWAAKTAMTSEFIHPRSAAIPFDERDRLRPHREPSPAFHVWAGTYQPHIQSTSIYHHAGEFSVDRPIERNRRPAVNTQATLLILGRLVLQIGYSTIPGLRFELKNESVSKLRRIWPPPDGSLGWPPPRELGHDDINAILEGLKRAFANTE